MAGERRFRPFALRLPQPPHVRWLAGLAPVTAILAMWWLATSGPIPEARLVSPAVLPSPGEVLSTVPHLIQSGELFRGTMASLRRLFLGFGLAVLIGVPLGIVAGLYRLVDAAAAPLVLLGRNIPVAALVPLTMLWFGINETQKVVFLFIATVPFVFTESARAVIGVYESYVEIALTVGAQKRDVISKVLIPLSLPDIYQSCLNLFGLAFGYIMLAEIVNAGAGLGYMIGMAQRRGTAEHVYVVLVVIGVLAWLIYQVGSFFGRGFFPWRTAKE